MHKPTQADQHNQPEGVVQKLVLDAEMLGGAEHVSRLGTRLRAEEVARPITPFDVDIHTSRMTEYESVLIRRYYHVPNYMKFRLPGPVDAPTRPPLGFINVYRDYFIRGL